MIERLGSELIDGDRLSDLFEISIDEVAWRKGHRYLTLIANHRTGRVAWGAEGKGQAAADTFFAKLDPEPAAPSPPPKPARRSEHAKAPRQPPEPAIMVPAIRPRPTVPPARAFTRRGLRRAVSLTPRSSHAPHG